MVEYNWVWALSSLGHRRRGEFLAILLEVKMKELSIFIDESGDFGPFDKNSINYIVTFVLHSQSINLDEEISKLNNKLLNIDSNIEYIHLGPIIRREAIFSTLTIDERRKFAYSMLNFINSISINHFSITIEKAKSFDKIKLSGELSKKITQKIDELKFLFDKYDKLIVYYDNGQIELSSILNAIFSVHFPHIEFRKANPQNYKLLQVADFICTLELLNIKKSKNELNSSEKKFFYKPKELTKTFLKSINKKRI